MPNLLNQNSLKNIDIESATDILCAVWMDSPIGYALISSKGIIHHPNFYFLKFLGRELEDVDGSPISRFTHEEHGSTDDLQREQLFSGEIENYTIEKKFTRKDGGTCWGELNFKLIESVAGCRFVCCTVVDICDRRAADEIRTGIIRKEFALHWQPVVWLQTGQPWGYEGLCRWETSDGRALTPNKFLNAARSSGLTYDLGIQMLRLGIEQLHRWQQQGAMPHISLNIEPEDLLSPRFRIDLKSAIHDLRLTKQNAGFVHLELLENPVSNYAKLKEQLEWLQDLGFSLSIDDYTELSSAEARLARLDQIDMVKIDSKMIQKVHLHSRKATIVENIVDLGRKLKLTLVAEGIEEEAERQWCIEQGIQLGQGYLFGKPLPAEKIKDASKRNSN